MKDKNVRNKSQPKHQFIILI